jgi:antitoxin CptB
MAPDVDLRQAEYNRLDWQCRRGMRELDELLRCFLVKRYSALDKQDQHTFSVLLEYPDSVLLELLMGRMEAADSDVARLVRDIRNAAQA